MEGVFLLVSPRLKRNDRPSPWLDVSRRLLPAITTTTIKTANRSTMTRTRHGEFLSRCACCVGREGVYT